MTVYEMAAHVTKTGHLMSTGRRRIGIKKIRIWQNSYRILGL
jgi:hypothetical protein